MWTRNSSRRRRRATGQPSTSTAFTLLHITQGFTYLLTFGAGIFIASVVYGHLAQKSGSILPGMVLHFVGDLAFAYFALLGGDSARLFVG